MGRVKELTDYTYWEQQEGSSTSLLLGSGRGSPDLTRV